MNACNMHLLIPVAWPDKFHDLSILTRAMPVLGAERIMPEGGGRGGGAFRNPLPLTQLLGNVEKNENKTESSVENLSVMNYFVFAQVYWCHNSLSKFSIVLSFPFLFVLS